MPLKPAITSHKKSVDLEKRLAILESEVNEMQKTIKSKKTKSYKSLRFWSSSLIIVIASLFFVFSIAGYWLKSNIVDTDVWVSKTSEIIKDPSVQNDVSTVLTDTIFTKFDVDKYVAELLPEKAQPLAGSISGGMKSMTQKEIVKVLQSQAFINAWGKLNRAAHSGLINSLENASNNTQAKGDLLYFNGDKLMLNIQPIYSNIRDKLASAGLGFVNNISPAQINQQILITEIKQMPAVLFGFKVINSAGLLMLIPMLIFGVIGLLIAIDRRRALLIFGVSSIVLLLTNVQAVYLLKYPFMSAINNALQSDGSNSAQSIFNIYTSDLIYLDHLAIILMVILVIFAFLAGPAKVSVWIRMQISKLFSSKSKSPVVVWLADNSNYLIVGLLIVTFLLVIFPLMYSVWYLVSLFVIVGLLCVLLLSLKSSVQLPNKRKIAKTKSK
jgi:hypothetical protein